MMEAPIIAGLERGFSETCGELAGSQSDVWVHRDNKDLVVLPDSVRSLGQGGIAVSSVAFHHGQGVHVHVYVLMHVSACVHGGRYDIVCVGREAIS